MGRAMLSKSLIQFSVDGWGCIPSLSFDVTTLIAESEEELKSLLIKVKEESESVGLRLKFRKRRSWHLIPSLHSK